MGRCYYHELKPSLTYEFAFDLIAIQISEKYIRGGAAPLAEGLRAEELVSTRPVDDFDDSCFLLFTSCGADRCYV